MLGWTALHWAASCGHREIVEILSLSATVDTRDLEKCTPLMRAVSAGHAEIVELLLKMSASVEEENVDGCTPLILASANGRAVCSSLLLFSGLLGDLFLCG
jgi:ankyrin repeat protein